ncbi:unnamed protein product [Linum trigynum]|uniref:Uncharacterized protein n=1 Tax=Linum trigynum TaxID=586398 RepID=A0AAV2CDY1_9ROSI
MSSEETCDWQLKVGLGRGQEMEASKVAEVEEIAVEVDNGKVMMETEDTVDVRGVLVQNVTPPIAAQQDGDGFTVVVNRKNKSKAALKVLLVDHMHWKLARILMWLPG